MKCDYLTWLSPAILHLYIQVQTMSRLTDICDFSLKRPPKLYCQESNTPTNKKRTRYLNREEQKKNSLQLNVRLIVERL